ncbi:hypothetical protein ACFFV7_36710 [Nonomuraea spiralis]|uniref:Uncharacterized protein n=1 Tax=Nonomuraea spiralis TaxID=46182 RepID=A0ABV5IQG8_9ACTN|nr:hypothetical protein [Nonomuraea spiralis]GGT37820.1 hypothetical protein GCM10010176_097360 [Nonomuraea spiralis]
MSEIRSRHKWREARQVKHPADFAVRRPLDVAVRMVRWPLVKSPAGPAIAATDEADWDRVFPPARLSTLTGK